MISTSFDRTVYPLNSIMHLRVRINKILHNELIDLQIRDYNNKIIFNKRINPKTRKPLVSEPRYGILYQIDFSMKGKKWKLGEEYTFYARYSKAESYSTTIISKRKSIILTDKTIYLLGSDAIITVIAPDFDLDNQSPDIIGNKKNNKITITSSKGKLSKYLLRETGDSTGIFQGVIGFIPGHYVENGKRMVWEKPKGKGPDDGYLPAEIGDRITITFKNQYETVREFAYVSNFGFEIELNKKTYSCYDEMFITVVSPDYNFSSDKIDSIGDKIDNKIIISSKKDKITNYRLEETGKDTGIFTGVVRLFPLDDPRRPLRDKLSDVPRGKGPKNGLLFVKAGDKIIVSFITKKDHKKAYAEVSS